METWITYISAVIVFIGVTLSAWSKIREYRKNRRGWSIGFEPFGIRYRQKIREGLWDSLFIRGTPQGHGLGELLIPTIEVWDSRYPEWARGRLEEIVSRVQSECPALPFVEEPATTDNERELRSRSCLSSIVGQQI